MKYLHFASNSVMFFPGTRFHKQELTHIQNDIPLETLAFHFLLDVKPFNFHRTIPSLRRSRQLPAKHEILTPIR